MSSNLGYRERIRHEGNWPPMVAKPSYCGHFHAISKVPPYPQQDYDVNLSCYYGWSSVCRDSIHPEFLALKKRIKEHGRRPRYRVSDKYIDNGDYGGDFSKVSVLDESCVRQDGTYQYEDHLKSETYLGGFRADGWPGNDNYFSSWHVQNAWADGTTSVWSQSNYDAATSKGPSAWRKFSPNISTADMGQFVGESREILPMLRDTSKVFRDVFLDLIGRGYKQFLPKAISKNWLSYQFGWAPFLSDLGKFFRSFQRNNTQLLRLRRENGCWVKRGGTFSTTKTVNADLYPSARAYRFYPYRLGSVVAGGSSVISSEKLEEIWFEGAFRYWIPEFTSPDGAVNTVLNYMRLYGLSISPLLVWNLTPWSWLADWVSNIGDNIANFTTQQDANLVAQYAYIMKRVYFCYRNNSSIIVYRDGNQRESLSAEWRRYYLAKTRRHASPFGFSTTWDGFTSRQWSLLGALGITRYRRN